MYLLIRRSSPYHIISPEIFRGYSNRPFSHVNLSYDVFHIRPQVACRMNNPSVSLPIDHPRFLPLPVWSRPLVPVLRLLTLIVSACTSAATATPRGDLSPTPGHPPTVADLVDDHLAFLRLDKQRTPIGAPFQMHYISTVTLKDTIWAYYIKWPKGGTGGIGLAQSRDGVHFIDRGFVLQTGPAGGWDSHYATFPGVWYDQGTWYLVYEADGGAPADIGLATSTDGRHFTKQGRILTHNPVGWERVNVGTPSLYKEGKTWYLYYHGYDGQTCQIGVATGPSLTQLTKSASNPIIPVLPQTWQSGTAGHRDIVKVQGRYYMTYEGSGEQPYQSTPWSSGLASSPDLIHWTMFPQNPVLPPTDVMTRNDGPTFLSVGGLQYIYYRAQPEDHQSNETWRALIANEQYGGFTRSWRMSSPVLRHGIGHAGAEGDWAVSQSDPPNHLMQEGPDVPMPLGDNIATWKLWIDDNTADTVKMVRLEVVDVDAGDAVLSQRDLRRNAWAHARRYEYFSVPFRLDPLRAGHRIALRVWSYGGAALQERVVGIS